MIRYQGSPFFRGHFGRDSSPDCPAYDLPGLVGVYPLHLEWYLVAGEDREPVARWSDQVLVATDEGLGEPQYQRAVQIAGRAAAAKEGMPPLTTPLVEL